MKFTIAIDGPAAAGKGTISTALAERFGFAYLDTGLLYRAVGRKVLETGTTPEQVALSLTTTDLKRNDLRNAETAQMASKVAAIPEVRAALLKFQLDFAAKDQGAILDGRDIGTVICPGADVKLYVTADAETRAERRFQELRFKGADTSYETVLADVKARDARDAGRIEAPMVAAKDAIVIDTTDLSIPDAIKRALQEVSQRLKR